MKKECSCRPRAAICAEFRACQKPKLSETSLSPRHYEYRRYPLDTSRHIAVTHCLARVSDSQARSRGISDEIVFEVVRSLKIKIAKRIENS